MSKPNIWDAPFWQLALYGLYAIYVSEFVDFAIKQLTAGGLK